jgi:tRNA-intron endonuclease
MAMPKIRIILSGNKASSNSVSAMGLFNESRYGEKSEGKILYSLAEALYLVQRGRAEVFLGNKKLGYDEFVKKAEKTDKEFMVKYTVFADLRNKGYLVKTALKFGADFRVYEKGSDVGEDHAKWLVFPVEEGSRIKWHDFASRNRVANSTKKSLLLAIVDEEGQVTYYESNWLKL